MTGTGVVDSGVERRGVATASRTTESAQIYVEQHDVISQVPGGGICVFGAEVGLARGTRCGVYEKRDGQEEKEGG